MQDKHFIGIDPGKKGAIAIINNKSECVLLFDCPLIGDVIDAQGISVELEGFKDNCFALIEKAQAMPGQGVTSMFNYGVGYGIYKGILTALNIPFQEVSPQKWKKEFSLSKDKSLSISTARQLFPKETVNLTKTKDGRSEALLIAEYGRRKFTGGF